MDTIKARINAAQKAGKAEKLTVIAWEPKAGDVLAGELLLREVIENPKTHRSFEKVTLRTDNGVYSAAINTGVLSMASTPVLRGDILELTAVERPAKEAGGKPFMETTIQVYHVADPAPF